METKVFRSHERKFVVRNPHELAFVAAKVVAISVAAPGFARI
jgi:hypothetical protein